jgi:hypothetical protein
MEQKMNELSSAISGKWERRAGLSSALSVRSEKMYENK